MKRLLIILTCLLPLCGYAADQVETAEPKEKKPVFTGFNIGISGNIGYAFAGSPMDIYRNGTLKVENLSRKGVTLGAGVMGRISLFRHMHIGAEGYVSTMPLMESGSSVRHGYAGALVDGYLTAGKTNLLLGIGLGGGKVKRMFVPNDSQETTSTDEPQYNASYTTTPFFYMDPYIGIEIPFGSLLGIQIKIDYLLPFGRTDGGILNDLKDIKGWKSFVEPSGPRLHVGVLIGK